MAMEQPDLIGDVKFATMINRKKHENRLNEVIEKWTSQRDPEDVMKLLQQAGVAAGIVETPKI